MYGHTVLGVDAGRFEDLLAEARSRRAGPATTAICRRTPSRPDRRVPADCSWSTAARTCPRIRASSSTAPSPPSSTRGTATEQGPTAHTRASPTTLGTAVNIVEMVYGNTGPALGQRCLLHARPGDRSAWRVRRLPDQRAGRGRRQRQPGTTMPRIELAALTRASTASR